MKDRFKVGETAKLLNVSPDTLRLYDKMGILSPVKDEENNYRSYSCADLICLDYILHLRKLNMPLKEVNKLMNFSSIEEEMGIIEMQEAEINRSIEELKTLKNAIGEYRKDLEKIKERLYDFREERSPKMVFLDLDDISDKAVKKFSEISGTQMPFFTLICEAWDGNYAKLGTNLWDREFRLTFYKHKRGIIDYDESLNDEELIEAGLTVVKPMECINVIVETSQNRDYSAAEKVCRYCAGKGYSTRGRSIIKVLTVSREGKTNNDYYEVWIPYEK